MRGRRIAFDYGDIRIGVAISDPDGILATPLTVLQAQSMNRCLYLSGNQNICQVKVVTVLPKLSLSEF